MPILPRSRAAGSSSNVVYENWKKKGTSSNETDAAHFDVLSGVIIFKWKHRH